MFVQVFRAKVSALGGPRKQVERWDEEIRSPGGRPTLFDLKPKLFTS
jgi:hypothetical protein